VQKGCSRAGSSLYPCPVSHVIRRENRSGSVVWRVRWHEGEHYRSETFTSRDDALRFRGLVDAAGQRLPEGWLPGHGFVEQESSTTPTLREYAARSIASRSTANDRTRGDYARAVERHVPDDLLDAPLDSITREQMGAWLIDLSSTCQPKTVKNVHGLLSSVMNDAVDAGLIARNPMKGLVARLPAARQAEAVFLTPAEFAVLLDAAPEHYRPLLQFFVRTGARFGEATALTVAQVDLDRASVRIDRAVKRSEAGTFYVGSTKSRRSRRSISVDPLLLDVLRPLVEGREPDALVFTTETGARVAHSNFTNRVWYRTLDRCEAVLRKRPRVHDLRHTHASWLIAAGVTLPAIQARLGHESITTTIDLYGHLMPDADRGAADALARLLD
jgi:integrase